MFCLPLDRQATYPAPSNSVVRVNSSVNIRRARFWIVAVAAFTLLIIGGVPDGEAASGPLLSGLHGRHPLSEVQSGRLLIGELRCAACHEGMDADNLKQAPDLAHVGSRLTADFVRRFIANPAVAQPGTTMPDVLVGLSSEQRDEAVESITAYLMALQSEPSGDLPVVKPDMEAGRRVFHTVGCVACHSPRDETGKEVFRDGVIPLDHVPGKFQPGALAAFLREPLKIRPSGRMPDLKLTRDEAAVLAVFLEGNTLDRRDNPPLDAARIEAGRRAFQQFNCTACHQPESEKLPPPMMGPVLGALDFSRGCLSADPGAAPNFHLSASQRQAIRQALEAPVVPLPAADRLNLHLTRLNCIACHSRDDHGGVRPELDGYFRTTEESLGDQARIPPPLTLVGAKLRPEWLRGVLHDGLTVRPYMLTRMPLFGEAGLAGLAELFEEVDVLPPKELPAPDQESDREVRDAALKLLGDQGLACISCHNYNGKESPGFKGLDLMTSHQRLQPAWFYKFMISPATYRPGIIMPTYWPDGQAVQTEVLGGDTDRQLAALWHKFSLGRTARDPSGLRSQPSILEVANEVRTYRGRSRVAGYRGIAVGFPEGLHYAFNAQNGALAALWQGGFIQVARQSQGAGDFNPASRPVQLPQDVAFLQLPDADTPWPLRPRTSEELPVNPDPLYPRNHGYAFVGYRLDDAQIPTFQYRCGPIRIDDRLVVVESDGVNTLQRVFTFLAPEAQAVWFRAQVGKITHEAEHTFSTPEVRITFSPATAVLRPFASDDGEQRELLIQLPLPAGQSIFSLSYELLR